MGNCGDKLWKIRLDFALSAALQVQLLNTVEYTSRLAYTEEPLAHEEVGASG